VEKYLPMICLENIFLRRTTGNCASFTCPRCGKPGEHFKISANMGECSACKSIYQATCCTEAGRDEGMDFDNLYVDLEALC
jgi:hypothetical protein